MKKLINKKGFTLVELLATVVILGIIMVVAIPNVIGILDKNRATTYVEDAKKLIARAEYALRSGRTVKLANRSCAVFNLAYLDNNEFNNGPYGHAYSPKKSFVVAEKNSSGEMHYYVRLIEPLGDDNGSEGFRGVAYASKDDLSNRNATELVINAMGSAAVDLDSANMNTVFSNYNNEGGYPFCVGMSVTPYIVEPGTATLNNGESYNPGDAPVIITDVTGESEAANLSCQFPTTNSVLDLTTGSKTFNITVKNGNTNDRAKFRVDVGENYVVKSIQKQLTDGSFQDLNVSDYIEIEKRPLNKHPAYKYRVEIDVKPGHIFSSASATQAVQLMTASGTGESCGALDLSVPYVPDIPDTEPPTISNISATIISNQKGKATLTWDARDSVKAGLSSYNVYVYEGSTLVKSTSVQSAHVGAETESMSTTIDGLNYKSGANAYRFTFKVCGIDTNGTAATESELQNAGASGHCAKFTPTGTFRWVFSVNSNISDASSSPSGFVDYGQSFTGSISPGDKRNCPGSVTVEKDGSNYTDYSYSDCNITVRNVTGNINIYGSCPEQKSSCLIEGTKVLLKNGKKKKIEDVGYDDLVAVWNHDTGMVSYEYPIWVERGQQEEYFTLTTFSDGTSLRTTRDHGVFSLDHNEFIAVTDTDRYKVGTRVAKIVHGKIKAVKIKKIEKIKRKVYYYQIVSTRYVNTITDDVLTSDATVMVSNAYGFDNNITWPKERETYLSNPDNYYKYSDFEDILPYYLYYGMLRGGEGKKLERYGVGKEEFRHYLIIEPMNESSMLPPETDKAGNRLWMVTTSLDKVTDKNKDNYKHIEGSYYVLPENNKVKYYINSADNKEYKPGEKVKVNCGMYFEAVKK